MLEFFFSHIFGCQCLNEFTVTLKMLCIYVCNIENLVIIDVVLLSPYNNNTADNQLNAKPVVKQRHPGDEFPVLL